ncbi:MAG: TetR family transcriptional regulator [Corynebacterium sp.]|nr:TetR family transcriptional regulator [Corynebacterium sp.]
MHSQGKGVPQALLQAWGLASPSRRGPKARLGLADVVSAAVELADEVGLSGVTLAKLARRLGLATTGLYRYVDDKEVLDELLIDAALGPPPQLQPGQAEHRVQALSEALWSRYETHPWLVTRPLQGVPRGPNAYHWLAEFVQELQDLGDAHPVGTAVAIDTLVRGFAQQSFVSTNADLDPAIVAELGRRYPAVFGAGVEQPQIEPKADLFEAIDRLVSHRWS